MNRERERLRLCVTVPSGGQWQRATQCQKISEEAAAKAISGSAPDLSVLEALREVAAVNFVRAELDKLRGH